MKEKKNFEPSFRSGLFIIVSIIAAFSCISYVLTIQGGDVNVFVSAARQADFIEDANFFTRAIKQWELKGAFMREYIYFLYSFAKIFSKFGTSLFMLFIKLGSLLCMLLIVYFTAKLLTKNLYDFGMVFSIVMIGLCTTVYSCHVQAELLCATLCLLIYAMAKKVIVRPYKEGLAMMIMMAVLISALFFLKSILVIMAFSILTAVFLEGNFNKEVSRKLLTVIVVTFFLWCIFMAIVNYINPNEIANMLNASIYQESFFNTKNSLRSITSDIGQLFEHFLKSLYLNPVILFGTIVALIHFSKDIKEKTIRCISCRLIMWMIPLLFILVSRKFFQYHYAVMIFPATIELLSFYCKEKDIVLEKIKQKKNFSLILIIGLILVIAVIGRVFPKIINTPITEFIMLVFVSFSLVLIVVSEIYQKKYRNYALFFAVFVSLSVYINHTSFISDFNFDAKNIQERVYEEGQTFNVDAGEKCLYLDNGIGTWTLELKSELNEFFPLSLQRIEKDSPYTNIPIYVNNKKQIMEYQGRYVCVQEMWFFDGKNEDIKEKINNEYQAIGQKPACWFMGDVFSDTIRMFQTKFTIYERKQDL